MAHRYFIRPPQGDVAHITGPDAAHLARVLRTKPGERLTLCDGAGFDYAAEVQAVADDDVTLRILSRVHSRGEAGIHAHVFIGYAKGERMDFAVQKSVELGAALITPFFSTNCVVKPKNEAEKTARFQRIAHEAAKQSARGIVPEVEMPCGFSEMLSRAAKCEISLFFYEAGGCALRDVLGQAASVALITGPEGGFTPQEAAQAQAAGCVAVGLGPRILRCETAPAAALAAVMALTGNLE